MAASSQQDFQQAALPPNHSGTVVHVVSSTWARDSHDLYDFEAQHLITKSFTVLQSSRCVRMGTDVQMTADMPTMMEADPLLRLVQRDGTFWVDRAPSAQNCKKLWLVVRDLPTSSKRLVEGDVIKLGRFKFRVRQLAGNGDTQPELRLDDSEKTCNATEGVQADLSHTTCRICLLEGPSEDDPLIVPCSCKGSIEYVHLGCLRHWIKGRLNLPSQPSGSYFFRPLACELCKAVYPTYVNFDNERVPLVEVPKTTPPFIVLENMVRDSQQHSGRGLHVVSLAEKTLKLGRGHESDVRIADVSISRCHATIRFNNGQFLLKDNNSKFGTLVALKRPRPLEPGSSISIQMGRTVLSLALRSLAEGGQPGAGSVLEHLQSSNMEDERALRLSLLTRASADEPASSDAAGAAGAGGPPQTGRTSLSPSAGGNAREA
eukprot:TRINITY_DN54332_c0_g1_i1.p1 TRINITY_DN54332_c0_g1~~TRINITY_DN54332_c0_g1_i1.p1  ORF type:complete len:432 (+),score=82.59 TRINITY_DN54332_c0_g1_i1:165-1460(+)